MATVVEIQPPSSFGMLLRQHIKAKKRSASGLAHAIGVDASYVHRIGTEEREPPRRHIVDAMVRELRLMGIERSTFYCAAGYLPPRITEWDAGMEAYCDLMSDLTVSEDDRAEFRDLIVQLSRRWRGVKAASNGHAAYLQGRKDH